MQSLETVIKQAKYVQINQDKLSMFAKILKNKKLAQWDNDMQLLSSEEHTVQYYFFIDSINFCFWAEKKEDKWHYKKGQQWINGYYAASYAIKEAIEHDPKLLNAAYLANIPYKEFCDIFKGKGELQLLTERHRIIQENFTILQKHFGGQALQICKQVNFDANDIVEMLYQWFPSFRDEVIFHGKPVYFLKRAQLFPSDINYALETKNKPFITHTQDLTVFADYKLPQLLQHKGVLQYNNALMEKIKQETILPYGSEEEMEIRASTIYACELLLNEMQKLGRNITSNQLDWMLWTLSKESQLPLPYHKTVSIYY